MVSTSDICLERAENEIYLANSIWILSDNPKMKSEYFNLDKDITFYSAVISHSYYAIFYCAKAYLISNNIHLKETQGQHQQVYFEFRKLVEKGLIDIELLRIYDDIKVKAEYLLEILKTERDKRTSFTYETLPQANKQPAEDSLNNALFFISHIKKFLSKRGEGEE